MNRPIFRIVITLSLSYRGLFSLTWLSLTYLTQRLEYRFHTARVIGSNPIVGKAESPAPAWQQARTGGVNWMTKASVASTCGLLRPPWHLNLREPPLLSSSLHVCGLPAPSRIDEQEQAKGARESLYSMHLPSSTIRWRPGGRKPQRKPFTAPHDSFAKRSLRRTPASASKEVSKIPPGDQVKVNSPEQIF